MRPRMTLMSKTARTLLIAVFTGVATVVAVRTLPPEPTAFALLGIVAVAVVLDSIFVMPKPADTPEGRKLLGLDE